MRGRPRTGTLRRLALGLAALGAAAIVEPQVFDLPGTQPTSSGAPAAAKIQHLFVPPFDPVPYAEACSGCHQDQGPTPAATPLVRWQGSMMAQAARDPLFYAQLDLTNADAGVRPAVAGMADMCLRCHSPVGWLEGRSTDLTGQGFIRKDLFGVQCHACHRLVDPLLPTTDPAHPDVANFLSGLEPDPGLPPTFGNGMYVMDPKQTRRGPYARVQMMPAHQVEAVGDGLDWNVLSTVEAHPVMASAFHRSGNLCGTCHDVSNPADCEAGADGEETQRCFPIERTWTEWRHSAFPARGESGNCQSCHMSGPLNGVAFGSPCEGNPSGLHHLNDIHVHDLTGGNAFVPAVILAMKERYDTCDPAVPACASYRAAVEGLYPPATGSPFADVDETALEAGIARVHRTLKRAAYVDVTAVAPELVVKVTNRTGHKLPTGYPEGRRMWLNVRFLNAAGDLIAESGRYDAATAALWHDQDLDGDGVSGRPYDVVQYTDPAGTPFGSGRPTKVWEGRMDHQDTGTEFHFALNDRVRMDNRIPPEGWIPAEYLTDRAAPVIPAVYTANGWQGDYGAGGGSAAHFDEVDYPLPAGTDRVEITLYYQTASREYIEALVADNPNTLSAGGFNRATLLQDAWVAVGRSAPVAMTRRVHAVLDADGDGLSDGWEAAHGAVGGFNDDPDGDGEPNWREFQEGTDPTDGASPGGDRDPVDIVLVLDISGSMNDPAPGTTTPKIQVLRDAVTLFLETWKDYAVPGDRIGVVYFGTDAVQYGAGPLLNSFVGEWQAIRTDVQTRPAGGWTAMGAGLYTAVQGLGAFDPGDPRPRHVILFSNGMQNRSPMVLPSPDFITLRDQTPAENPEVTGGSNVTLPGGEFILPLAGGSLVRVHTVGIGVAENSGGTAWHKLLKDVADMQQGKHNFITRAYELEGTFLEDLVQALRGNTLEYVLEAERRLAAGGEEVFEIPINATASRFTLVLSWSGQAARPPTLELVRPDGVAEDVGRLTRGGPFYRVVTRYLSDPDEHPEEFGTWVLRVRSARQALTTAENVPRGALPLRLHALLDDTALKYQFGVPGRRFRVGQPLRVTARATQAGQALRHMERITVELTVPGASVGAALAASDHRLDAAGVDPDLAATPFSRKLIAAFADERWRARLAGEETVHQLLDDGRQGDEAAGDGTFSRTLLTPAVPGHYELRFRMEGYAADGRRFVREETVSIVAGIGRLDPGRSRPYTVELDERLFVVLTPRDAAGNLLGPGYASQLTLAASGRPLLPVEDLLDGSYRAPLPPGVSPGAPVVVGFDGETVPLAPGQGKKYAAKAAFFEKIARWLGK